MGSISGLGNVHPTEYRVQDHAHSTSSKLKVISIGAGASGLYLAYSMDKRMKNFDLTVYEKNSQIGGTWLENVYPGCACDIPAHIYTYTFRPNPKWSSYFVGSDEILRYFQDFADEFNLQRFIKFQSTVTSATYDEENAIWNVEIDTPSGPIIDWCDILINSSGILNKWKWPTIPNRESFKGTMIHSAAWDRSVDYSGKRVAVIGTGSSGIQIVPQVQSVSKHLTVFIRSPTWISPPLGSLPSIEADPLAEGDTIVNRYLVSGSKAKDFTKADIEFFESNPDVLLELRKKTEMIISDQVEAWRLGSPQQIAVSAYVKTHMEKIIGDDKSLKETIIPHFPAGCRRLTPGPGFLQALGASNVTRNLETITRFTPAGIETADGINHSFDIIICATGFDVAFVPFFKLRGKNGVLLSDAWKDDLPAYLGIAAKGFPNYFVLLGPRGPWGNGSIIPAIETNADYFVTMMQKIQSQGIKSIEVKQGAVDDFVEHNNEWHVGSVWGAKCRNWYRRNGSDTGIPYLWCGMSPSYFKTMKDVRFEDYDYEYKHKNRFSYLGNGKIQAEYYTGKDKLEGMTTYIRNSDTPWFLE
ncbi:cyclohexanone monooxygenase [Dactylonectria macrodidyma]|uniref:Cyclohexanone monooxygenase n=1 Tax=Dactylonectria macrodidyma TaxID=307937 RepID=A0A9P9IP18_9HYPO|nr:cyclohexanone monooxygenase [Dactylonectria macrodidyma]